MNKMKNEIIFEIGKTNEDIMEATRLSLKVFNKRLETSLELKKETWLNNQIKNQEVAICKIAGKIVGVIRIVPLRLRFAKEIKKVACLTSVCIDEDYRGLNLSSKLMKFTQDYCNGKDLLFQLVVASRNVDHYYLQFGFEGISSYQAVTVRFVQTKLGEQLKIKKVFSLNNTPAYSEMYNYSYKTSSGSRVRTIADWKYIQKKIKTDSINFYEIFKDKRLIAYVAMENNKVIEISIQNAKFSNWVVDSLLAKFKNNLMFEISFSHVLKIGLENRDCTWHTRTCAYGGHMLYCAQKKQTAEINKLFYTGIPEDGKLPFNIPYFDRF